MGAPMTPRRIVVTGGTGFVGRAVLARAAARWPGARLVVPTRRAARAGHIQTLPGVELVECDVHDEPQVAAALAGADALVHLVAILHGSPADFARVHVALPHTLAQACRAVGVPRVVHVSALAVAPDAPSEYLRSKAAGEAVWRASGLAVTILRPSVIFGAEDRFTNLFAALLRAAPVLPLAGATAQFQPVWVGDVAAAIVEAVARPELADQVIDCAGPEVLTLEQIVRRIGAMTGFERPVWPLSESIGRLQAAALALLPGGPPMSRDNLLSMRVPNVASGREPGLAALGISPAPLSLLAGHFAPSRR